MSDQLSNIHAALEIVTGERKRTVAERDAFGSFAETVHSLQHTPS